MTRARAQAAAGRMEVSRSRAAPLHLRRAVPGALTGLPLPHSRLHVFRARTVWPLTALPLTPCAQVEFSAARAMAAAAAAKAAVAAMAAAMAAVMVVAAAW